jgi:hypothetical protein
MNITKSYNKCGVLEYNNVFGTRQLQKCVLINSAKVNWTTKCWWLCVEYVIEHQY